MMNVSRRIATLSVLSLLFAATACSSSGSGGSGNTSPAPATTTSAGGGGGATTPASTGGGGGGGTVTLGEVSDFSGVASVYGTPEYQGAQIAVDQINAAGGIKSLNGSQLAIKKYDTASNPDQGVTQATAAVGDKVSAVFGGEISDTVLAGINVTQRAGVPWVDTGGIADEIHTRGYKTVFMVDHTTTQFLQDYINVIKQAESQLKMSNPSVAIAYSQSSYGQGFYDAFNKINKSEHLKVTTSFGYPLTTTDFSSVAARLAASPADIIFDMGYPGDGLALARLFATKFKVKAKMVLAAGSDAGTVVSQLKSQANGVVMIADLDNTTKNLPASYMKFYNDYQAKYHAVPNSQAMCGYIAVQFIAAAMESAKSSQPAAIAAALPKVSLTQTTGNIYPSPATLQFASDGSLAQAPFYAAQVINGKAQVIYPTATAQAQMVPYGG